jgi:hypothetical protein
MYSEGGGRYWVVTVIEPEHADRVQYRSRPAQSQATIAGWKGAFDMITSRRFIAQSAVVSYAKVLAGKRDSARVGVENWDRDVRERSGINEPTAPYVDSIWTFLGQHRSDNDRALALRTLQQDGNDTNRTIAAMLLMNFHTSDSAWWALVDAQRDSDDVIQVIARTEIQVLAADFPRKIDWKPVAGPLRHILAGTGLFSFGPTTKVLMTTGLDTATGKELLRDNADLLLAYLGAHHKTERELATSFLKQATGMDFGQNRKRWKAYLASLRERASHH